MSEQGRARALAELRCARCKQHRAELGPEQRLCYVCRVEVRAADPSERQGR